MPRRASRSTRPTGQGAEQQEYDSLSKEIEFQNLEIQLAEKRIKEGKYAIETKGTVVEESKKLYKEREEGPGPEKGTGRHNR